MDRMAVETNRLTGYHTKQDLVYLTIKEAIVNGSLPPGERLVIRDLAARLQVSETPVRVALARLTAEGLAEHASHLGAVVSPIRVDDLKDVHAIIGALQGMAAERAAERITPPKAAYLEAILAELERLPTAAAYLEFSSLNRRFHGAIAEISGYIAMPTLLDQLFEKLDRSRILWSLPAHRELAREEHREILRAVLDGAASEARLLMERHWRRSGDDFAAQVTDRQLTQPSLAVASE